tara:strand:- start:2897 stop:3676 length:780 start_codon:yes stop_codon:yes gene_type:complete
MVIKNEELLRTYAPAAFAEAPEEGRVSDRYSFLPTTDILEILQDEGWTAWKAQQVKSRTWSKDHAKHIIRLRHEDLDMKSFGVGDSFPEMLLMNAHNGLGSYDLMGGIFRMVCSNGMVISESDFGKIHIRHIGFEPQQVVEASKALIMNATKVSDKIGNWQSIDLTPRSQQDFFADAAKIRFENPSDDIIKEMSQVRREADRGTDLWRTFNVAQENLIRGGFRNGDTNRMVRPISNIQKDVKFNSELWDLASTYSVSVN